MIRRIFGGVAAAILLLFVPMAAAQAYPAPAITFTASDATPTVGVPFTVTASDLGDATEATLTITSDASIPDSAIEIAGTQALTKPVTDGTVSFTVTLNEPGAYTLTLTTDVGSTATQVLTAVAADAGGGGGGGLPETGTSNALTFAGIALALVVAGGVVLFVMRRRSRETTSV